jgi:hypothetical protein
MEERMPDDNQAFAFGYDRALSDYLQFGSEVVHNPRLNPFAVGSHEELGYEEAVARIDGLEFLHDKSGVVHDALGHP